MKFTFVDDKKIVVQRIFNGKTEEAEIKYEATADGKITISEDGKDQPGTWKIEMGNLILTPADRDDEILLVRPAK